MSFSSPNPPISPRSVSGSTSATHDCPVSTVTPDANGWVPPGTCGYVTRPYYPSFAAALVVTVIAAGVFLGWARTMFRATGRGKEVPRSNALSCVRSYALPSIGVLISLCLLAAYILRAFGTKHQQVPEFVAYSDVLILMCPILVFALDCNVCIRLRKALLSKDVSAGLSGDMLLWSFLVIVPLLTVEQLIASLLIAPKHKFSPSEESSKSAALGLKLYLIGIGLQEIFVIHAFVSAALLRRRLIKSNIGLTKASATAQSNDLSIGWERLLDVLMLSLGGVFLRVAYRLIELSAIFTGMFLTLMHNEIFFYTLECLPILLALGVWIFVDLQDLTRLEASLLEGAYDYHPIEEDTAREGFVPLRRMSS